jgi:hypothetical protein
VHHVTAAMAFKRKPASARDAGRMPVRVRKTHRTKIESLGSDSVRNQPAQRC